MNELVFWQNAPSIHQAPMVREIARKWPGEVLVVAESDLAPDRLRQGWNLPNFEPARVIIAPTVEERAEITQRWITADCVHVFTGFQASRKNYQTFKRLVNVPALVGLFAEAPQVGDGLLRPSMRRLRYMAHAIHWSSRLDFFLVAGELGARSYRNVGFPSALLYPYGYFVDCTHKIHDASVQTTSDKLWKEGVRLLFVGQFIRRKGVDLFLQALAMMKDASWHLCLLGSGPVEELLRKTAIALGLSDRITWLPCADNAATRVLMGDADLLVLPSRYDGWGAVVNEALAAGTRVIVSDRCGAMDLVQSSSLGTVFKAGSVRALAKTIASEVMRGPQTQEQRALIQVWAREAISPEVVADYFLTIVAHARGAVERSDRPVPPWRNLSGSAANRLSHHQ